MGNEGKVRRGPTPEELAAWQEQDRLWRLEIFPPQIDTQGIDRQCVLCRGILNPLSNQNYDGSVGGYCNKLCRRAHEKKLMDTDNMSPEEASIEVDKYEDWKPLKHSPVLA